MVRAFVQEKVLLILKVLHLWAKIGNATVLTSFSLKNLKMTSHFYCSFIMVKSDGCECLDIKITDGEARCGKKVAARQRELQEIKEKRRPRGPVRQP